MKKILIFAFFCITIFSPSSISCAETVSGYIPNKGNPTSTVEVSGTSDQDLQNKNNYEHILNFNSDITINKDSTLNVVEKIKVYANNQQINHGIYRDFPTVYIDDYGNKYKINFSVVSVKNNGQEESYKIENLSNGVRVYMGKSDTIIIPGVYDYEISYKVNKELGFFDTEDVLYWNVTGNGWVFSIDKAEATVHLPEGVTLDKISMSAYTGYKGMKDQNFYSTTTENSVYFSTTEELAMYQGLTIAIGWPKGYVQAPTQQEKILNVLSDNVEIIISFIAFIIILLYYITAWFITGRDPEKGSIIAEYEAPEKLSPAAIRFNFIEGYDNKVFTSAVISMAVKGCLKIDKSTGYYKLIKTGENKNKLSDEEVVVFDNIFVSGDEISINQANYKKFESAQRALNKALENKFVGPYFIFNFGSFKIGILLSIIFLIIAFFSGENYFFIYFVLLIGVNVLFFKALKKRTRIGRLLADKIEGFKLFLSVTEEARLNFANPPEKTPELFERFIPYALALGVLQNWSEQFSTIFNMTDENQSYHPIWYMGSHSSNFSTLGDFTNTLDSSLSHQISSSSHAPGSSSGGGSSSSHGGGSSGGGGGGGGGGGW